MIFLKIWSVPLIECDFFHTNGCDWWHMWGKLCAFTYYNVQYVMLIVTSIITKLKFDSKLWHILHKCQINVKL